MTTSKTRLSLSAEYIAAYGHTLQTFSHEWWLNGHKLRNHAAVGLVNSLSDSLNQKEN